MQGVEECRNRRRRRRRARRVVVVVMCSRARVRVCVFARVCMRALRVLEVLEVETADEEKQRRLKQAGPPSPPPLPLPVLCLPPPSPLPPLPPHVCRWRLRAPGSLYAEATPAAKRAGKKKQPPPHSRLSLPSPPLLVSPSLEGASCKLLIYRLGGGNAQVVRCIVGHPVRRNARRGVLVVSYSKTFAVLRESLKTFKPLNSLNKLPKLPELLPKLLKLFGSSTFLAGAFLFLAGAFLFFWAGTFSIFG